MNSEKKRSSNFSGYEINSLMKLIFQEFHVIENKKSDHLSLQDKKESWQRIHNLFNSTNIVNRDLASIKVKYDNIKRNLKKTVSQIKKSKHQTGGDPPANTELNWYEEQLYNLLRTSIDGLPSEGDFDSGNNFSVFIKEENIQVQEDSPQDEIYLSESEVLDSQETSGLKDEMTQSKVDIKKHNFKKRKRITTTTTELRESLNTCNKLAESETELSGLPQSCYEAELNNKKQEDEHKQMECDKKQELLGYDLLIKKEQYQENLAGDKPIP
ncbi:unnamed protein product [Diabrotica balteata]|uniref:Regulatory protein zeste n=1 Tax=Diabrotica balteata TaxID=107213 RepID=A0A9N9T1W7_DIABA|nr:unnamed protein product [Diabrotica balteata]